MPSRDDLYILPDSSELVKHFFEVLFKRTGIRPAAASCRNSLFSISPFRPVVKEIFLQILQNVAKREKAAGKAPAASPDVLLFSHFINLIYIGRRQLPEAAFFDHIPLRAFLRHVPILFFRRLDAQFRQRRRHVDFFKEGFHLGDAFQGRRFLVFSLHVEDETG